MMRTVGIDFGTAGARVACHLAGRIVSLPTPDGGPELCSSVAFTEDGGYLIGRQARDHDGDADRDIIRRLGLGAIDSKSAELAAEIILGSLRTSAEAHLGERVSGAVITVPVMAHGAARRALLGAARAAGLDSTTLLNAPLAAALARASCRGPGRRPLLVFDLGHGTTDAVIATLDGNEVRVLASWGHPHLGVREFDARLAGYLADLHFAGCGTATTVPGHAGLVRAAGRARLDLSGADRTVVRLPPHPRRSAGRTAAEIEITRELYDALTGDLWRSVERVVHRVMDDAGTGMDDVDILPVGEGTLLPAVLEWMGRGVGGARAGGSGGMAVHGAAVWGAVRDGLMDGPVPVSASSMSLGIGADGGAVKVLIPRGTTLPASVSRTVTVTTREQRPTVIHLVEGEATRSEEAISLGRLVLDGRGSTATRLAFEIDGNGLSSVVARDAASGTESRYLAGETAPPHDPDRTDRWARQIASSTSRTFDDEAGDARASTTPGIGARLLALATAAVVLTGVILGALASFSGYERGLAASVAHVVVDDTAAGSGFVYSEDGLIVTCHHVVDGASLITVRVAGVVYRVDQSAVTSAAEWDLAVIDVPATGLRPLTLSRDAPGQAENVWVVGTPEGVLAVSEGQHVRTGRLRGGLGIEVMQIRADVRPGFSGGPVTNSDGEVVGIVYAHREGDPSIAYAVPARWVLEMVMRAARTSHSGALRQLAAGTGAAAC